MKKSTVVKKLPASDTGRGVWCTTKSGKSYCISHNPTKGVHTLWKVLEEGYEKIATGKSPYDLYPKIDWDN